MLEDRLTLDMFSTNRIHIYYLHIFPPSPGISHSFLNAVVETARAYTFSEAPLTGVPSQEESRRMWALGRKWLLIAQIWRIGCKGWVWAWGTRHHCGFLQQATLYQGTNCTGIWGPGLSMHLRTGFFVWFWTYLSPCFSTCVIGIIPLVPASPRCWRIRCNNINKTVLLKLSFRCTTHSLRAGAMSHSSYFHRTWHVKCSINDDRVDEWARK